MSAGARTTRRGPGRRPGAPDTRGEVLAAARAEFGERGYDGATMRGIAARAGVDAALVHHYFGAKEQVFVAAMQVPAQPAELVSELTDGPPHELGARVVTVFLRIWGHPASRAPFLALLRNAIDHETAAAMLRQFIRAALLSRVAASLDVPDADLRVEIAASHLVGLALLRYVVRLEPLASATDAEVVRIVGPTVQRYLTGDGRPA